MKKKELEGYEKYIFEAKEILRRENLTKAEINLLKEKLDIASYFYGEDNYKIEILYGKLELKLGNNVSAIEHFKNAILKSEDDEPKAAYYGLFKSNVYLKDYKEALYNLALYDSCFSNNLNLTFCFKALYKVLELQGFKVKHEIGAISEEGYINAQTVPQVVLNQYKKVEQYFEAGDYKKSCKKLEKCEQLCKLNNCIVNFKPLIMIIKEIDLLKEKSYKEKDVSDRINECYELNTNDEKKAYLKNEINDPTNVYAIIELVKILIQEANYEEAYSWLNHKMDLKIKETYIRELNELRKIVYEEYNIIKNQDKINFYLSEADNYLTSNNYSKALKIYKEALEKLSCPLFLYKMAEVYYSIGNMKTAKKYFNNYLAIADKYKIECFIYLDYIDLIFDKSKDESKYSKVLSQIEDYNGYLEVSAKAENGYYKYIANGELPTFEDKDEKFNESYKHILSSIKSGDIFKVERINSDKIMREDHELIKIAVAPTLLEKGATHLADLYCESAVQFIDNDKINDMVNEYKKIRDLKK